MEVKRDVLQLLKSKAPNWKQIKMFGKRLLFSAYATFGLVLLFNAIDIFYFFTLIGALFGFILLQALKFFINKFLDKSLEYTDFDYIKHAFSIISKDLLFLSFSFLLLILQAKNLNSFFTLEDESDLLILKITLWNPVFMLFVLSLTAFSYRAGILKQRLMNLQYSFKKTEESFASQELS
ncbi:MAG: hypothetical protein K1060chlam2_01018 [Chlamydiae bacterium]|nr:hypothetical protein [Chlamydiota bacterium]